MNKVKDVSLKMIHFYFANNLLKNCVIYVGPVSFPVFFGNMYVLSVPLKLTLISCALMKMFVWISFLCF